MILLTQNQMLHRQHLCFIETHRSTVEEHGGNLYVSSEKDQYTYAVLGEGGSDEVLQRCSAIHYLPWSGDWSARLVSNGFEPKEIIDYMLLERSYENWRDTKNVNVRLATTDDDIELFTQIQGRSFIPDETTYQTWYPWFLQKNLLNSKRPEQQFHIGFVGERPASTTFTIAFEGTLGIYAVGTLPEFRNRGVACTVMKRALEHAAPSDTTMITLQTVGGSAAERLYFNLGFSSAFLVQVYRKAEATNS